MRTFLACVVCRLVSLILKIVGRGATTLPGKLALKIKPNILAATSKGVRTVLVTGTNGKTTTCKIIEQGLRTSGKSYLLNAGGANLISGISTAFIMNSSLPGKSRKEFAIVECDEAAFRGVSAFLKPEVVLVTNIFRDQLDRFGDTTTTLEAISAALTNTPGATLCLNADCSLTYSLSRAARERGQKVYTYGVNLPFYKDNVPAISDAKYCRFCDEKYSYSYHTFAHLGGFFCEKCGYKRENPDLAVEKIVEMSPRYTALKLRMFKESFAAKVNLPGSYNVYNAIGAALAMRCLNLPSADISTALSAFDNAAGRMESFSQNGRKINMILVKNPTGLSEAASYLSGIDNDFSVYFCVNDNIADGTDISWIYDAELSPLLKNKHMKAIYTAGSRTFDAALLLKYSGVDEDKIHVLENDSAAGVDYQKIAESVANIAGDVYIVPTYTAMMKLRPKIAAKFRGK